MSTSNATVLTLTFDTFFIPLDQEEWLIVNGEKNVHLELVNFLWGFAKEQCGWVADQKDMTFTGLLAHTQK